MSQITKGFVETVLRAAEAGRHTPLTIWQETQLALAWLELEEHRTRLNTSFPDVEAQVFAINDSVEGDEVVPAALARELVGMLADQAKRERENAIILSMGANQTDEMYRRAEVAERRVRELELNASFHRRDMEIAVTGAKEAEKELARLRAKLDAPLPEIDGNELTRADIANGHGEGPFVPTYLARAIALRLADRVAHSAQEAVAIIKSQGGTMALREVDPHWNAVYRTLLNRIAYRERELLDLHRDYLALQSENERNRQWAMRLHNQRARATNDAIFAADAIARMDATGA